MENTEWLTELESLTLRFAHLGLSDDMKFMSTNELWGLYKFLSRLNGEM